MGIASGLFVMDDQVYSRKWTENGASRAASFQYPLLPTFYTSSWCWWPHHFLPYNPSIEETWEQLARQWESCSFFWRLQR
jgi:hypothetical protein